MKATVRNSGDASGGPGSYVNTGVHHGDVYLSGAPIARSAYREQVEQIFPWPLVGREAELAELAAFCTGDHHDGGYMWWQGEAWAGKTALMATFVLHPPPNVRVVSFFITGRYIAHSGCRVFLDLVIEQLAELLGQPMPAPLNEATRQGWFARLLKEAAAACLHRGERLVLVVDGLDEDRGVMVGPDVQSIAALLPAMPADGLRVVVTGRPYPPVPSDVPARHPLRDPSIVRMLKPSPEAEGIREVAERELDRLLFGTDSARDLLGLVVAAGGGLSVNDLAEIAGLAPFVVDRQLRAVSGRTFTSRDSTWRSQGSGKVLMLAHEELHSTAIDALGEVALGGYRELIHAWADGYRARGWSAGTPEYLLRGYHRMLLATGDLPRLVACATDRDRLDRMLDMSGGDAAALAEIVNCQDVVCSQENADLRTMLVLARTREFLADRNAHIPTGLPAVWSALGNHTRAEALAHSITDPYRRALALCELVDALVRAGLSDKAAEVASQAHIYAATIDDPDYRVKALSTVVQAFAQTGQVDQALHAAYEGEATADDITMPYYRSVALTSLAEALIEIDQRDYALKVASLAGASAAAIDHPDPRAAALSGLAGVFAQAVQLDQALRIAHQAETNARQIGDPQPEGAALSTLVGALAQAGQFERAEALARTITEPRFLVEALSRLAYAHARASRFEYALLLAIEAETAMHAVADPYLASALNDLVVVSIQAGRLEHAEVLARAISDAGSRADALSSLAGAHAHAGHLEHALDLAHQAETTARDIVDPYSQAEALSVLGSALVDAAQLDRALRIVEQAETAVRDIAEPASRTWMLIRLLGLLARAGQLARAEGLLLLIEEPDMRARALGQLASILADAGQRDHARRIAQEAETAACKTSDLSIRGQVLRNLIHVHWSVGDPAQAIALAHRAETTACDIAEPDPRTVDLSALAGVLADIGQFDLAARAIQQAESAAREIADSDTRDVTLVNLVRPLVRLGYPNRAESLASTLAELDVRLRALTDLACESADLGLLDLSAATIHQAEAIATSFTDMYLRDMALSFLVDPLARAGQLDRAESLARDLVDPQLRADAISTVIVHADAQRAHSLTVWALTCVRSDALLEVIAKIDPSAIAGIT
ncbi:hypothetical protein [Nonomuraea sp. NPDC001023]|uniref:hypothetical protein n=1 Tax=unclassified Nonomuraea TaxID=2593643 RepID=UPI00331FFC1C